MNERKIREEIKQKQWKIKEQKDEIKNKTWMNEWINKWMSRWRKKGGKDGEKKRTKGCKVQSYEWNQSKRREENGKKKERKMIREDRN